jgi:uroporphyrin-III C-methyltransferase
MIGEKKPRLTLVGAGPGDPELLTIRGVKAIQQADVILYDALVSDAILELIPKEIPSWFVGKRAGTQSFTQDEINRMVVELAFEHGHVVRLKGGDPFIFGRGHEELEHASAFGLYTAVIPGITSAISVPENVNIPLTRRGVSESFWVITGTTRTGNLSNDIVLAAQSTATIVILMGLNKIEEIMKVFITAGKGDTPVAVIQDGTLPTERLVNATVKTITEVAKEKGLGSPAIIVVGDVATFARQKDKFQIEQDFKRKVG